MKIQLPYFLIIIFLAILTSCNRKEGDLSMAKGEAYETAQADSISDIFSSYQSAADNLSKRQFIRTAKLKFRVENVIWTTQAIEKLANSNGGFVTASNISSTDNYIHQTQVTEDSLLETHSFTLKNDLIIRVPDYFFDSALADVCKHSNHWEFRNIEAEDVSLSLYGGHLTGERLIKKDSKLRKQIDSKSAKLKESIEAEEQVFLAQENYDLTKLAQMELADKIKFSTINITINQRPVITKTLVPMETMAEAYERPYGQKMADALIKGSIFLESLSLFLITIWPVMIIAALLFWLFRKRFIGKGL